jgi:predicted peptidase
MPGVKLAALAALGLLVLGLARARADKQPVKHGFTDRTYDDAAGKSHKYVLFVPYDYTGDKPAPIILFLHGAGEREGGQKMPVEVGIGPAIRKYGVRKFPFFVLIPQCGAAPHNWSANGPDARQALAMLDNVEKTFKIDPARQYLTGLSMGGFGTWSLAAKYPDRWAAIAPVCGGGNVAAAERIKDLPCWCFHGGADPVVKPELSRDMIHALKQAGGKPKLTEYPGVGHNSWDRAYGTRELYDWFLKHRSKTANATQD